MEKIPEVLWLKSMTNAEQTQGRCDHNECPCMGIQREQPRPRRCKGCVYLCFGWVTHCVRMRETIWPWHDRPLHLTTSIWDVSAMSTTGNVGERQIRGAWLHHFRRRPGPGCTLQTIEFYFTKHRLGFRAVPPARCLSLQWPETTTDFFHAHARWAFYYCLCWAQLKRVEKCFDWVFSELPSCKTTQETEYADPKVSLSDILPSSLGNACNAILESFGRHLMIKCFEWHPEDRLSSHWPFCRTDRSNLKVEDWTR